MGQSAGAVLGYGWNAANLYGADGNEINAANVWVPREGDGGYPDPREVMEAHDLPYGDARSGLSPLVLVDVGLLFEYEYTHLVLHRESVRRTIDWGAEPITLPEVVPLEQWASELRNEAERVGLDFSAFGPPSWLLAGTYG